MRAAVNWLIALVVLGISGAGTAATAQSVEGRWAVRAGAQTIMLLELASDRGRPGSWTGFLSRPQQRTISLSGDAISFSNVNGPVIRFPVTGTSKPEGGIRLLTSGREASQSDAFLLNVTGPTTADLSFANAPPGVSFPPMPLVRAAPAEAVAGAWAANKGYLVEREYPTNREMTAIFEADQADRRGAAIDWSIVGPRDKARMRRTKELLDEGALNSGTDFENAAFIFQHGDQPADYLLAHTVATVAVARGKPEALWIAAATLDRYLQSIKQPQIYGTQYSAPNGGLTTQEPYDRKLVTDTLRKALGVPSLAEQDAQRQKYNERNQAKK